MSGIGTVARRIHFRGFACRPPTPSGLPDRRHRTSGRQQSGVRWPLARRLAGPGRLPVAASARLPSAKATAATAPQGDSRKIN